MSRISFNGVMFVVKHQARAPKGSFAALAYTNSNLGGNRSRFYHKFAFIFQVFSHLSGGRSTNQTWTFWIPSPWVYGS